MTNFSLIYWPASKSWTDIAIQLHLCFSYDDTTHDRRDTQNKTVYERNIFIVIYELNLKGLPLNVQRLYLH